MWHVHGSWSTAFVQGGHHYLVPTVPSRGPDGRGRAETWDWPPEVVEVEPEHAGDADVDVLIAQRLRDLDLFEEWFGRRPGIDVPVIYVEHNTPPGPLEGSRHPLADRDDVVIVHVTSFNDVVWDCGDTRTIVIEHGVADPGPRFVGDLRAAAAVINEPARRGRAVGADLLGGFGAVGRLDVFGMGTETLSPDPEDAGAGRGVHGMGDVVQARLHTELGRRRCYIHPFRWTSLGLALIEAMMLGIPVVALGATGSFEAVPDGAGLVSTRLDQLHRVTSELLSDVELGASMGRRGRNGALERFGLGRFLTDWDRLLQEVSG
jgi:hypothetical protein